MSPTVYIARIKLATVLCDELAHATQRCEIVGSIRRGSSMPSDIELLCEPHMVEIPGLFGDMAQIPNLSRITKVTRHWGTTVKAGDRYQQIVHHQDGHKVDLFLRWPPAQWGVLKLIRTGPAFYSRWMVQHLRTLGLPVKDGCIRDHEGCILETPTERHVFALANLPYAKPEHR